ncbi:sphingomyelin phosphodiesterase-like [Zerene cesonia]|uniref:sphingomyelin phosphodiesterase-like n=1 Tax=Zerene cesonia TaxID=33412 RepID=UPI0018E53A4F|nr:sphingomyelin phosphodiesterase-like [Zerene cesonia]
MKVFLIVFIYGISVCVATKYLSSEDLQNLFFKAGKNQLNETEKNYIQDLAQILYLPQQDLADDRSLEPRSTLNCLLCRSLFAALFDLVNAGVSDEDLIVSASQICIDLSIVSPRVCHGAVLLNGPIITYIIRNTPEAEPRTFCAFFLQTNTQSNNCNYNDERYNWEVELPPPSTGSVTPKIDNKPLTVAIISDAHIDPLYEPFGVADCSDPTCCRAGQTPNSHNYTYNPDTDDPIVLNSTSEVNGQIVLDIDAGKKLKQIRSKMNRNTRNSAPAGYWGDYRNCDSPIWAYDDVIDRIHSTHKDIDMIYYLGDTIDHHVWETTYELINDMNLYLVEKIRKTFGDHIPVLATIGNHESQPTNQFAPERITDKNMNTTWLYEGLAKKWEMYLTEEAKETMRRRGEYSMVVRPGLRVISINNNVAYKYNWWLVFDPMDAKRHLDWLVSELYKAEQNGEKVHILSHIPPGVHDLTYTWTREYNRIINRFKSTIAAEFNGHLHSDEFRLFYDENNSPVAVAWGGGSATAYINYNLNYKIATFGPQNFEPLSINSYIYNLTEANLTPGKRPHWFQLYDLKNTYGIQDLSPTTLNNLVHSMVTDKKTLLDIYNAFYSKLSDTRWPYCNEYCKIDNLCKVVVTVLFERERCEELRRLFFS